MLKYQIVLLFTFFLLFTSCSQTEEKRLGLLQEAKGGEGEMLIVMDSIKWKGKLGDAVGKVFQQRTPGIPQPEGMFTVSYVEPLGFKGLLMQHHSIVIVTTFDLETPASKKLQRNFTANSLKRLDEDASIFMLSKKNEFAKGQQILHLFAKNEADLIEKLQKNKKKLQEFFNEIEEKKLQKKLFKDRGGREINNILKKEYGFKFNLLTTGFQVAKRVEDFVWLRHPEVVIDKNIFVARKKYTSEKQFELDSIIAWRNELAFAHLYGDPENENSYVETETIMPVISEVTQINEIYSVESKGLWKTHNISMGGAFVGYTLADLNTGYLYYIEGFIYAPTMKKREVMREIEVIVKSFRFENE